MDSKDKKISYKYNIFKLLSVSILLVSVTFCWFIFTKDTSVDSINLEVTGTLTVTISDNEEGNWGNKIEVNNEKNIVTEFSGDGRKLYSPIVKKNKVEGYVLNEDSIDIGSEKREYIEITTWIKTDGPICLYLSPESKITPYDDSKLQDNIAGALRVAVLVQDYNPFIWVPNTTYQYDETSNTVNKDGEAESSYSYVYNEFTSLENKYLSNSEENYIIIENKEKKEAGVCDSNNRFIWGDLNKISNYLSSVDPIFKTDQSLNEEIKIKVVIRIWVEGTDREAVKSLVGGKFNINLSFLAIDNK